MSFKIGQNIDLSCYEELDLDFKGKTVLITGNFERYEKRDILLFCK